MRRSMVHVFVLAALVGGFFVSAMAGTLDPAHMNGTKIEEVAELVIHPLLMLPLGQGRVLEAMLISQGEMQGLLIILHRPEGTSVMTIPW